MDIIVDFETMGLYESAIPLSLGITCFELDDKPDVNKLKKQSLFVKFNQLELKNSGKFTVDESVISWWKKQDKEIIDIICKPSDKDLDMVDACIVIRKFAEKWGYDYKKSNIWARGMDFDLPKLKYLYKVVKMAYPFNPFKGRDVRTYIDILGGVDNGRIQINDEIFKNMPKHIPINDTIRDAYIMQMLYQEAIGE